MKKRNIISACAFLAVFTLLFVSTAPKLNNTFFTKIKTAAENASGRIVAGNDGWYFLKSELTHLAAGKFWGNDAAAVSKAKKPNWADPLPAIVDFNNQLKAKGIKLIFLPVPAKASVYPEKLDSSLTIKSRPDYYHYRFIKTLRDNGVSVIDIMPLLYKNKNGSRPVYCKTDAHWSPYACELAAAELAAIIKKESWFAGFPKIKPASQNNTITVSGDLSGNTASEKLAIRLVTGKSGQFVQPSGDSPVILVGDSHTLIFHEGGDMLAEGGGLADQLALELGFAVDLIGVRGSGSTASRINLFRKSKSNPEYLTGKKTVIWCITVREFTESTGGWKIVPVSPK